MNQYVGTVDSEPRPCVVGGSDKPNTTFMLRAETETISCVSGALFNGPIPKLGDKIAVIGETKADFTFGETPYLVIDEIVERPTG
jgi:hypothetical protein